MIILIFHRVIYDLDTDLFEEVSSSAFDKKLFWLSRTFQKSSLGLFGQDVSIGRMSWPGSFVLTFDDGYADNYSLALPILKKHGISATFFIASGYLDGGWMWNDGIIEAVSKTRKMSLDLGSLGYDRYILDTPQARRSCIQNLLPRIKYLGVNQRNYLARSILDKAGVPEPAHLMMTSQQVREMHQAGMEIGGHTVSHPILSAVDTATARREIFENKEYLESLIGVPLRSFAYPNGKPGKDYGPEHVALLKEAGYSCAVSTQWGKVDRHTDPFQMPRFTPWNKNTFKFVMRLMMHSIRPFHQ